MISLRKSKGVSKEEKEKTVLFGLVEVYLKTGKPVGSNTLREAGFEALSSATIRNYFGKLEEDGYLEQMHTSGGRVPTAAGYRRYAVEYAAANPIIPEDNAPYRKLRSAETREIASYMQNAAEKLCSLTDHAVFISAPRFDHDYVTNVKLVPIDYYRCLAVLITDFGVVHTELLNLEEKISAFSLKRVENYFHWRLTGLDEPENLDEQETRLAHRFYNELMVRYIVGYSNFINEEIYQTGFSKLLLYPEFQEASRLASALALFENAHAMRLLLKDCAAHEALKFWIGDDLNAFAHDKADCTVIAAPYYINQTPVGAVGLLGPCRTQYRHLFGQIKEFADSISEALTRNLYKFKITYRQPEAGKPYIQHKEQHLLGQSRLLLLEDQSS